MAKLKVPTPSNSLGLGGQVGGNNGQIVTHVNWAKLGKPGRHGPQEVRPTGRFWGAHGRIDGGDVGSKYPVDGRRAVVPRRIGFGVAEDGRAKHVFFERGELGSGWRTYCSLVN